MGRYRLGYTDLITLRIMERYGVNEIFSSDTGFDTAPNIKRVFLELKSEEGYGEFLKILKELTIK